MKTNQQSFDSWAALAIGSAVILGVVFAAATTHAASCESVIDHINYSASFKSNAQAMKLVVGTGKSASGNPAMIAQILSAGRDCQAVCHVRAFERNENTLAPVSMDLECQATRFKAGFNAPVTLIWATSTEGDPEIRIGTWLDGYQKAALRVELDHYQVFSPGDRVIAQAK